MKKQGFFIIKAEGCGRYGFDYKIYFQNLERATKMFEFLVKGETVIVSDEDVPQVTKPDKDNWVPDDKLHYIKKEGGYTLGHEILKIYTKKEIEEIRKDRKAQIKDKYGKTVE